MDNAKTTRVELKSKLGRPFYRFGQALSPDHYTAFDLTDEELASIKDEVTRTVKEGGALEIKDSPWKTGAPAKKAQPSSREQQRARAEATRKARAEKAAQKGTTTAAAPKVEVEQPKPVAPAPEPAQGSFEGSKPTDPAPRGGGKR